MLRMQRFVKRSRFEVPASELFAWHARLGALRRLTPPWERVELLDQSGGIRTGARVVIRLYLGPVPRRWTAVHTAYEEGSLFRDEQREGPFAHWVHTHRVLPDGPSASLLEDDVEYALPLGGLGRAFGLGFVRRRLERMFAYRHALTGMDLGRHAAFAGRGPLEVAVSGASGLVGSALVPFLTTGGHQVRRLVRGKRPPGPDEISWDPAAGVLDSSRLEGLDAVVHLSGASIAGRWTAARKAEIRQSRIGSTRLLCEALARLRKKPRVLVCASATGLYGDRGDELLTEASPPGEGFLADVVRDWEAATLPAREAGIRVVLLRLGVVLSPRGGALAALAPVFKAGAGGPVGGGAQWMSWIGLEDLVGAIHFALMREDLSGPVNATAPGSLTQRDFAHALGRALHRPSVLPLPALAVRGLLGEAGQEMLLSGARVQPAALEGAGFRFLHPGLPDALRFMYGR